MQAHSPRIISLQIAVARRYVKFVGVRRFGRQVELQWAPCGIRVAAFFVWSGLMRAHEIFHASIWRGRAVAAAEDHFHVAGVGATSDHGVGARVVGRHAAVIGALADGDLRVRGRRWSLTGGGGKSDESNNEQ